MLKGNIGADIELSYTAAGLAIAKFSVAYNYGIKDKKHTSWFDVVAFGKKAEYASKYIGKGTEIVVEGSLQKKVWENKEGKKQTSVSVLSKNLTILRNGKFNKEKQTEDYSQETNYNSEEFNVSSFQANDKPKKMAPAKKYYNINEKQEKPSPKQKELFDSVPF